ncbi:SCAN domain-containing protein 3 [Trichinella zimbabwensis]|uniref:SCAN domain-containing protein 3 n=1 Tax=Trichinella zimbabwensis TaxID=268475 RepID=A0A0V1HZT3_9BILA|nr:SCAN domain-containing protein 3 [Trichinella zimbabwensis]
MASADAKKKSRQYSQEYLKFGFIASFSNETMPMCLLCQKVFSNNAMKPSKIKDHLERVHPDKKNKDIEFFKVVKEKIRNQPNLKSFFKAPGIVDCEGGLKASYSISLNIAKKALSYSIGEEIVIPAIKEVIETVMKKDSEPVLKCIPLSAKTVQRRIDEMASDVERTLVSELQHCKFSIQLAESAFGCSNILMAYVRYYSQSLKCILDEFLFASYLKGDAKGERIFRCLEDYLKEHNVPLRNITAVATDGAPTMVGRYRGFATLLKETVPDVRAVHCVLHRHHLVAKNLSGELHAALKVCIKAVNKIKGQPMNSRLFATLCEKNDETFNQLLFHTEVRWLSRGDCLQRLVDLYYSTVEFLADVDQTLCEELNKCKNYLFYLADLYSKFKKIQKRLQGKDKLEEGADVSDRDLEIYISHLEKLREDFKIRFEDLENMTVPDWIITPFDIETENVNIEFSLQEEHVEMSADLEAKLVFKNKSLRAWGSMRHQGIHRGSMRRQGKP